MRRATGAARFPKPGIPMMVTLRSRAVLAFALFALAACSEETPLPTDLATAEATEDVELTQAAFETAQTTALVELGSEIDAALAALGGGATLSEVVAAGPLAPTTSADLAEGVAAAPMQPQSSIPASALGKTFEWDPVDQRYEATLRTGAPANGVVFIIYQLDAETSRPATPLVEIGSALLTQEGTASNPSARFVLRNLGGTTVLEYLARFTGTQNVPAFAIEGTAGTGPNRVEFSLTVGVNIIRNNVTAVWSTEIPSRSLTTRTTLGVSGNSVTLNGVMRRGLRRIDLAGTFNVTTGGSLTVRVGNRLFATLTFGADGIVTATGASGATLTPEEQDTLELIFGWFRSSLTWYNALLDPVQAALGVDDSF